MSETRRREAQTSAILLDDAMVTVEVDAVLLHPLLAEVPSGHDVVGTSGVRGHTRLGVEGSLRNGDCSPFRVRGWELTVMSWLIVDAASSVSF